MNYITGRRNLKGKLAQRAIKLSARRFGEAGGKSIDTVQRQRYLA